MKFDYCTNPLIFHLLTFIVFLRFFVCTLSSYYNQLFFQDDDTRNVMTAMTNQTTSALESLKFYVVTKSWFVRAWPILTAKQNELVDDDMGEKMREHIGKIQNSELVFVDTKRQTNIDENNQERVCLTDESVCADSHSVKNQEGDSSLSCINRSKLSRN